MTQPQIDKLIVEITQKVSSKSARAFSEAFAAATDDPENYALIATIAWLLAEPLPAGERVDRIATLVGLARP